MNGDLAVFVAILQQCVQTAPSVAAQVKVIEKGARLASDIMALYGVQPAAAALPAGLPACVQRFQLESRNVATNWASVLQLILHSLKYLTGNALTPPVNYVQ